MDDGLYIVLISVHGLIRGDNLELGRDADTGGQTKYVVELAKSLAKDKRVARVDLITRSVIDQKVSEEYSNEIEKIGDNANIIRVACGPKRYLRKEVLWTYLENFIDGALKHIRKVGVFPDILHGHYADAGFVASKLSHMLEIPSVFTGHSLGRVKLERLLEKSKREDIEKKYNISARIEAEEVALNTSSLVITSTNQEINEQYREYENYKPEKMKVIPPGVDIEKFEIKDDKKAKTRILKSLNRFLTNTNKPIVLALSRADERKNIGGLIKAFGENRELRKKANLVVIAGFREDIREIEPSAKRVLTNMLYLIDYYDLYGEVAYPKNIAIDDIPLLYQIAKESKGLFVNPALTEPFGLTLIEAGAMGTPIVATNDGGPNDIIRNCENGVLIDPFNSDDISNSILKVLNDEKRWELYSQNGLENVKKFYTWDSHVKAYLNEIDKIKHPKHTFELKPMKKFSTAKKMIIVDIDNTLLGEEEYLKEFVKLLNESNVIFGVATGRTLKSAKAILEKNSVAIPDIFITSVGTEIYYGKRDLEESSWHKHISYRWNRAKIVELLKDLDYLEIQPESEQSEFKISFNTFDKKAKRKVRKILRENGLTASIIYSHNEFLDILPVRASKGQAIRHLALKWGIFFDDILVAGDSGNDEEMLKGDTFAVVVSNYSKELEKLKDRHKIYFASKPCAGGIIEGIKEYSFLE